jgi:GNAT superfamily N-acetyltransferase
VALLPLVLGPHSRDWHGAYFHFVQGIFPGLDFLRWYAHGGWTDSYEAHVLCDGPEIVANVAITHQELLISGQPCRGAQLGAVGVAPKWRGQGLQRRLMGEVMGQLQAGVGLLFLFANDEVLDFYPRFGFRRIAESIHGVEHTVVPSGNRIRCLDVEQPSDRALLARLSANRQPLTERFGARNYGSLLLFYASSLHRCDFFVVPGREALVVARQQDDVLTLLDVIADHPFDLVPYLARLTESPVRRIEFGFTPELWWPDACPLRAPEGSTLFVRGDVTLPSEPFTFPVLAHA